MSIPSLANRSCLIVLAVLFSTSTAAWSQEDAQPPKSVKPGINEAFLDPELNVDEWVKRFEVESREVFAGREEVVTAMKLKPGDRIADVGTGTGPYVELFSKAVGDEGWVYALDIAPKFVGHVGEIVEIRKLKNVTPVLCGQNDVRLPPASIDAAFICDVYHHFEYPEQSLASLHKAMVPGGKLVLIDFERIPGESRDWTIGHVRAGKEVFRAEIMKAGFKFVDEVKISNFKENYFLMFERK